MTTLRAALVTPLTGPLASFGKACATGLTLWAEHAALLPPPWTDVELDVRDTGSDVGTSIRAALDTLSSQVVQLKLQLSYHVQISCWL